MSDGDRDEMVSHTELRAVLDRAADKLRIELVGRGWTEEDRSTLSVPLADANHLVTFSLPVASSISVVVVFVWVRHDETGRAALVGYGGIHHGGARDLLKHLESEEILGAMRRKSMVRAWIADESDVQDAVSRLSEFAVEHAYSSERDVSIEHVVQLLTHGCAVAMSRWTAAYLALTASDEVAFGPQETGDPIDEQAEVARAELIAALYAVGGQNVEARDALSRYAPGYVEDVNAETYRNFVSRMERWLDGHDVTSSNLGADDTRPSMPTAAEQRERLSRHFLESVAHSPGRNEALASVRRSGLKGQEETRALLERELRRHGVSIDARELDAMVDLLRSERRPFGKMRVLLRAVRALWDLGRRQTL